MSVSVKQSVKQLREHRYTYNTRRNCHNCNGSGAGRCLVVCHVCKGRGSETFGLYASDLEGVTLVLYTSPTFDESDKRSRRLAPKFIESERRPMMLGTDAHEVGAGMLARGEIVKYSVIGYDDFAKMSTDDRETAWAELRNLTARREDARKASEDCPWEEEEQALYDLRRMRMVDECPKTGALRLTEKGAAALNAALLEEKGDQDAPWIAQCLAYAKRETFLEAKAAQ